MAQVTDAGAVQTYGLTAEQKARLDAAPSSPANTPVQELPGTGAGRQIHGEVAGMVGSNGARGLFGAAAIPLGDNGGAVISYENTRYGSRRWR